MRTLTTTILMTIAFMFAFSSNVAAQTATKQGAKFYDLAKGQTFLNINISNIDTANFAVEVVKTKGSRLYIEYTFIYEGGVQIDKLNAVATAAFNSSRVKFELSNESLKLVKDTKNVLFVKTNNEIKEITEKVSIKIFIPETITFVGM